MKIDSRLAKKLIVFLVFTGFLVLAAFPRQVSAAEPLPESGEAKVQSFCFFLLEIFK